MKQINEVLEFKTNGKEIINITTELKEYLNSDKVKNGIMNLTLLHTSASIIIQENADPDVLKDLLNYFEKIVEENSNFHHSSEGPDDMPAHIKSTLTQSNTTLSIINSELVLGIWQDVYLFEHRVNPKIRKILVHIVGE